jgi:hypothetical protein
MKTQARFLAAAVVSSALLASAAAGASGSAPNGQFAATTVLFRGDVVTRAPRPHGVGGVTTPPAGAPAAHKAQAPSSYALHSLLVRAPAKPDVVRAQGG